MKATILAFFSAVGLKIWPYAEPVFKGRSWLSFLTFFLIIFMMAVSLFLCGCTTVGPVVDSSKPEYFYRPDVSISFDNQHWYEGMAVWKLSGPLTLHFKSNINMDRVEITTCSRHWVTKEVNSDTWFGGAGHNLDYIYEPDYNEQNSFCPMHVLVYSKDLLVSWGMVFFRREQNLPAHMDCNGHGTTFAGITGCSTRAGLEEQLTFFKPVMYEQKGPCTVKKIDPMNFLIRNSDVGFCEMSFTDGKDFHDFILHGYEKVL